MLSTHTPIEVRPKPAVDATAHLAEVAAWVYSMQLKMALRSENARAAMERTHGKLDWATLRADDKRMCAALRESIGTGIVATQGSAGGTGDQGGQHSQK